MVRIMVPIKILLALALLAAASPAAEWKQLFNHKDLTGWQQVGPGRFGLFEGVFQRLAATPIFILCSRTCPMSLRTLLASWTTSPSPWTSNSIS